MKKYAILTLAALGIFTNQNMWGMYETTAVRDYYEGLDALSSDGGKRPYDLVRPTAISEDYLFERMRYPFFIEEILENEGRRNVIEMLRGGIGIGEIVDMDAKLYQVFLDTSTIAIKEDLYRYYIMKGNAQSARIFALDVTGRAYPIDFSKALVDKCLDRRERETRNLGVWAARAVPDAVEALAGMGLIEPHVQFEVPAANSVIAEVMFTPVDEEGKESRMDFRAEAPRYDSRVVKVTVDKTHGTVRAKLLGRNDPEAVKFEEDVFKAKEEEKKINPQDISELIK